MSDDNLTQKMEALRVHYRTQLATRLPELESLMQSCAADHWPEGGLETLLRHAHQLAGMAATYGFPEIGTAGKALEEALRAAPDAAPQTFLENVQRLVAVCQTASDSDRQVPESGKEEQPLPIMLVVDDDPIVAMTVRKLLQQEVKVISATSAAQARNMLAQNPVLILLDQQIEGEVSGIALLKEFRLLAPHLPIIMLTADAAVKDTAFSAGATAFLSKPFSLESGAQLIRGYLPTMPV